MTCRSHQPARLSPLRRKMSYSVGGRLPDELQHLLDAFELLSSPGAATAPEKAILDAALDGTLTQRKLDGLLAAAATAQMIGVYRGDLGPAGPNTSW